LSRRKATSTEDRRREKTRAKAYNYFSILELWHGQGLPETISRIMKKYDV